MADYIDPVFKKKYIHPARKKELISAIIEKDSKAAKQELAKNYLWLAFRISEKYKDKIPDLEMRVGDAAIALFQAVAEVRKKPKRKKFEDFAGVYIEKILQETVDSYNNTIRVSKKVAEKMIKDPEFKKNVIDVRQKLSFHTNHTKKRKKK